MARSVAGGSDAAAGDRPNEEFLSVARTGTEMELQQHGYTMLGVIIERVSDLSYAEFVRRKYF